MTSSKLHTIPLYKLVPNIITILALCLGITSVRYALDSKFTIATTLLLVAALMDSIDGRMARLLNCSSSFGAQLDSLADMVSFGVAPCLLIYMWSLHSIPYKGVGWAVVLIYIACSALRLARFNVQQEDDSMSEISKHFFVGVPIPAAASMALIPMIITFDLTDWVMPAWAVCMYMIAIGVMMVSTVPTFSAKKIVVTKAYVPWLLLVAVFLIAAILFEPWVTIPLIGMMYCLSIPCSIIKHRRMTAADKS